MTSKFLRLIFIFLLLLFINSTYRIASKNANSNRVNNVLKHSSSFPLQVNDTQNYSKANSIIYAGFIFSKLEISNNIYVISTIILFLISGFIYLLLLNNRHSKKQLLKLTSTLEDRVTQRTKNLMDEIANHKKTEQELVKSELKWNKAQEVANIGNWEYHISTQKIWGSIQAFRIFDIERKSSIIKLEGVKNKIHGRDLRKVKRFFSQKIQNTGEDNIEFRIKSGKSGNPIYVAIHSKYISDNNGVRISGTIQDISTSKQSEFELIKAKEKAEESDQLKSAFLSNMSHEIRTPMNAIIGFSQLLNEQKLTELQRKEYISLIQNNGFSLINLIDSIIDLSKIDTNQLVLNKKAFNLNDLLIEIKETVAPSIPKGVELKLLKFNKNTKILIHTDENRLRQIIINLVNNAIKFTSYGTIKFGYEILDTEVFRFFISDTGIGISKKEQEYIFDRFRKAERNDDSTLYGGTGLGLSLCKYLVMLLKGEIWVESQTGIGSTFYFTMPYKELRKDIESTQSFNNRYDWSSKTILIAEDELDSLRLLKTILQKTKINILSARTGKEAISKVLENDDINLILMDLQLPEIDGFKATKIIKKTHPKIPIIAQTAFTLYSEKERSFNAGCDGFISKPINIKELMSHLSKYFEKQLT